VNRLRPIAEPFVVAPPRGIRIRTRLRVSPDDASVLWQVGLYLGHLAGENLAWRCRAGLGADKTNRASQKRLLTAKSSSRWAGTLMRTSDEQWRLAMMNLRAHAQKLQAMIRAIEARVNAPVGGQRGRVRGYANRGERWQKQRRLQVLRARLAEVEGRLAQSRVSVVRGGRRLAATRHHLSEAHFTEEQWRRRWQAERLYLSADGDAEARWGNRSIRVHPEQGWCEVDLPPPLEHLANRPDGRYRLTCRAWFSHRPEEWAAQVATGAVHYDITLDATRNRWYLHASWRLAPREIPTVADLRQSRVLAVDLNVGHLAAWVVDPSGNPVGGPRSIPLLLEGQRASTRDGRLRLAISQLIDLALSQSCRAVAIENLDFPDARSVGRETLGRGARGRWRRRTIAGIPYHRFRSRLVQMCTNRRLWVLAVDPAYTSKWASQHWLAPLQLKTSTAVSGHHAAAVVIGRRAVGHRARRRPHVPAGDQRIAGRRAVGQAGRGAGGAQGAGRPQPAPAAVRMPRETGSGERSRPATRLSNTVRDGPSATSEGVGER